MGGHRRIRDSLFIPNGLRGVDRTLPVPFCTVREHIFPERPEAAAVGQGADAGGAVAGCRAVLGFGLPLGTRTARCAPTAGRPSCGGAGRTGCLSAAGRRAGAGKGPRTAEKALPATLGLRFRAKSGRTASTRLRPSPCARAVVGPRGGGATRGERPVGNWAGDSAIHARAFAPVEEVASARPYVGPGAGPGTTGERWEMRHKGLDNLLEK